MSWEESYCKKGKYHEWTVVADYEDATKEVCTYCGEHIIWNKDEEGRIDNAKYLRSHVREFAQPSGVTSKVYRELYGKHTPYKKEEKRDFKAEIMEDFKSRKRSGGRLFEKKIR